MRYPFLLLVMLGCAVAAPVQARPIARVPTDAAQVLERLPTGYSRIAATAKPSLAAAIALLEAASRSGDARLARRGDAMLQALPQTNDPALLRARAYAAQHRHDFKGATALLDRVLTATPRDGNARLVRAQVALVQGRVRAARGDCGVLAFGVDSGLGMACSAAVALRTGRHAAALRLATRWLDDSPRNDGLRIYVAQLRAEAAARLGDARADAWFREAVALDPADVRTRAAYSRYLLGAGRAATVRPLLRGAGDSDGLALLRALAAHANGDADADALADNVEARFALAHRLGLPTELRDEAELELTLRGNPDAALALALRNFRDQRDFEDVRLLQRAARAAGNAQALDPLRAWAQAEQLALPGASS